MIIVLVGGCLYYSQVDTSRAYSVSIMSCAVADCPNGVTRLPTPPDVSAILLAGDARSLFYKVSASSGAQAGALFRCDLPGCTTPIDMGGQAEQEIVIMGEDVFVPAAQFQSSYYVCTRARCSTNLLATPEPELQSGPFASRPFAVDATTIYWATTTIFDNPGNLVLATPRK